MIDQQRAPFLDGLKAARRAPINSFHMPGHKFKPALNPALVELLGEAVFEADLNEIHPLVDYLHAPRSTLLEAQQLAAAAVGADRSYFLVNGSTVGNQAMLLTVAHEGQEVVVPRAAHRSVYAGLILSGAVPVYVPPLYHPLVEFPLAVPLEDARAVLERHPDAVALQITSPNYYGYLSDVGGLAALAHQRGLPLLVDEAHGAHLPYHPDLPADAVSRGADLVVQSSHKTIGALTQAALLHHTGQRVDVARLERILSLLQSSSPSALLTASLDAARQQMATAGKSLLDNTLRLAHWAREQIRAIPGLWCYGAEIVGECGIFAHDPTKLVIRVSETGWNGHQFVRRLAAAHQVYVEFEDPKHIICSVTIADDEAGVSYLLDSLGAVAAHAHNQPASTPTAALMTPPPLPEMILTPRQANVAPSRPLPLEQAAGHIAAEQIMPYPPGIPLVLPGERLTRDLLAYLRYVKAQGIKIVGPHDPTLATVRVIVSTQYSG